MSRAYRNKVGRLEIEVFDLSHGGHVALTIPDGWNETVPKVRNELTREELHDLRYLIDRALAAIGSK